MADANPRAEGQSRLSTRVPTPSKSYLRFYVRRRFERWQSLQSVRRQGGTDDYTRFIILGRPRVGSTLLQESLDAMGAVTAYGEVFANRSGVLRGGSNYPAPRRVLSTLADHPTTFLDDELFRRHPVGTDAVGFKFFYHHASPPEWQPVWDHLGAMDDLRVIHLTRADKLAAHLSEVRGRLTGVWVSRTGATDDAPVELDPDTTRRAFEDMERLEQESVARFAGHEVFDLGYEEMASDVDATLRRVCDFLGTPYEPIATPTRRQSSRPKQESIANYDELCDAFAGSRWASFFDD